MTHVSIITVSFKSAKTIADTCRSIAAQTHSSIEHLIIDGGSSDGTCEIARQHCRPGTIIISEPDKGIYDAMNKGVQLASGDIVGFVNADDVLADSGVVARMARVMRNPLIDACFSDLVYVDQDDTSQVRRFWKTGGCKTSSLCMGWIPPHPTFYVRRHHYEPTGPFDTSFRLAADHELMCRLLARRKLRVAYSADVWVHMRLGGVTNQSIKNILTQNLEILLSLTRHRVGISPAFPFFKLFDRIRQRRRIAKFR